MPSNSRKKTTKEEDQRFHVELAKQMLTLATAAFGLVAALAWNQFIQEFVNTYIKRWFDTGGKLLSMGILEMGRAAMRRTLHIFTPNPERMS